MITLIELELEFLSIRAVQVMIFMYTIIENHTFEIEQKINRFIKAYFLNRKINFLFFLERLPCVTCEIHFVMFLIENSFKKRLSKIIDLYLQSQVYFIYRYSYGKWELCVSVGWFCIL